MSALPKTQGMQRLVTLPPHFFLGIILVAVFWAASWLQWGLLGEYSFFPLWLGYILTVDGLVAARQGESLLTARPRHLVALFLLSAPIWWMFEGLNRITQNWHYLSPPGYTPLQIVIVSSLYFSTVVPAVFETTLLLLTFRAINRLAIQTPPGGHDRVSATARLSRWRVRLPVTLTPKTCWVLMYIGAALFFVIWFFPRIAYPFLWVWLFLLVDPLNALRQRPSLIAQWARGDFRLTAALALGALVCGFFWEMWNFFAFPKWYYTVAYVGFWKIFEMPLFGYLGYIPFAWELYALYHLAFGFFKRKTVL